MATSSPALIVPVNLQALAVPETLDGGPPSSLAGPLMDYATIGGSGGAGAPAIASSIVRQPFGPGVQAYPGVHLHWALPAALTHWQHASDTAETSAPAVPNRWIVVRMQDGIAPVGWVIESDFWTTAEPDATGSLPPVSVPWKLESGTTTPCAYLGRVTPLSDWTTPSSTLPADSGYVNKLTALGHGISDFAAFYPNCSSVFGFHDDVTTLGADSETLSYLVLGWFSEPENDPVLDSGSDLTEILKDLGWQADGAPAAISGSVYSGVVSGVTWTKSETSAASDEPVTTPKAAVGETVAGALATLIANLTTPDKNDGNDGNGAEDLDTVEQFLTALLLGNPDWADLPGGPDEMVLAIAKASFAQLPSGKLTSLRRTSTPGDQSPAPPLSYEVLACLNALNAAERAVNLGMGQLQGLQAQMYMDWQKYMGLQYPQEKPSGPEPFDAADAMKTLVPGKYWMIKSLQPVTSGGNVEAAIDTLTSSLQPGAATAKNTLNASLPATGVEEPLLSVPDAPYFKPISPAVAVAGDNFNIVNRTGTTPVDGAIPPVACRLSSDVISALSIAAGAVARSSPAMSQDTKKLDTLTPNSDVPWMTLVNQLLQEVELIDPAQSENVSLLLSKQFGMPQATIENFLAPQLENALEGKKTDDLTFTGTMPNPLGFLIWAANPFLPLIAEWSASFRPVPNVDSSYDSTQIISNFALSAADTDLQPVKKLEPGDDTDTYQGYARLTPYAGLAVINALQNFINENPTDPLSTEATTILKEFSDASLPCLSIILDGFIEALLQEAKTPQLPVADPRASGDLFRTKFTEKAHDLVGEQVTRGPLQETKMAAIRSGLAEITDLRLIDVFGQNLDIAEGDGVAPYMSQQVTPPDNVCTGNDDHPTWWWLAPRLSQPARLTCRFVDPAKKTEQTNPVPPVNPLCGWVVVNPLDNSLMLYAASGAAIGQIFVPQDPTGQSNLLWMTAPGSGLTGNTLKQALGQAKAEAAFASFFNTIYGGGPRTASPILDALNTAVGNVSPPGAAGAATSTVMGRPLALVQLALTLELSGPPAAEQSVASLSTYEDTLKTLTDAPPDGMVSRPDMGITNVQFPVLLGDETLSTDGLIGYAMLDGPGGTVGDVFYVVGASSDGATPMEVQPITPGGINLCPGTGGGTVYVLALVEPSLPFHATSGILPVQTMQIPADQYGAALSDLAFTALTAPVLAPNPTAEQVAASAQTMTLPIPTAAQGPWTWMEQQRDPVTKDISWQGPFGLREPNLKSASDDTQPLTIREGWLIASIPIAVGRGGNTGEDGNE